MTGPESEANQAGLYFYGGPAFSMDVDYDRFIHRLGHEPLGGLPGPGGYPPIGGFFDPPLSDGPRTPPEQPGYVMWGQDFKRATTTRSALQTLDAKFKVGSPTTSVGG